jgi:hypothetical protein
MSKYTLFYNRSQMSTNETIGWKRQILRQAVQGEKPDIAGIGAGF